MTIAYNSNVAVTGFDATTAGTLPSGWVNSSGGGAWKVNTTPATFTNHTHTFSDSSNVAGSIATLTGPGTFTDVEVTGSQQVTNGGSITQTSLVDIILRGNAGGTNGYMFEFYFDGVSGLYLVIYTQTAGSFAAIAGPLSTIAVVPGTQNINFRVSAVGTTLSFKIWQDGTAEPASPQLQATDLTYSSGYVGLRNDPLDTVVTGVTDLVVNTNPYGEAVSIIVFTPTSPLAAGGTVTGAYTGLAPTGLTYALDGATSFTAVSSPTIGGGTFSFAMPSVTTGYHQLSLDSTGLSIITSATAAFKGTASAAANHNNLPLLGVG